MELKMLSLFSGIGAFEKALENIGIKINLVNFCEIDKYASQAYCAIHNVDKKLILYLVRNLTRFYGKLNIFPYKIISSLTVSSTTIFLSFLYLHIFFYNNWHSLF